MTVNEGTVYHLKEEFFDLTLNCGTKSYSPNGRTFPVYCCFKDKTTQLLWMIPMSKNIKKYRVIHDNEMARYGHCYSIVLGVYDDQEVAFQVQSMFPVMKKHILCNHTRNGKKISVERSLKDKIKFCFDKVQDLNKKGIKVVLHDNRHIERLLNVVSY